LDDLAPRIVGRAANDRCQVRGLRHELAVIDYAKRQDHKGQKRHQKREFGRNRAAVSGAM
jgi:hypothetical protein